MTPTPARSAIRVLVVGESWIKHTIHMKGFDAFQTTTYEEGGGAFLTALDAPGIELTYVRGHEIAQRFPTTAEALAAYDVVALSDIGANSFLLTDETFVHSRPGVNRLSLIADHVRGGGGLLMIGGYLSFAGIDGRARYGASPLADVLPVRMLDHDDRVERPEGVRPRVAQPLHPMLAEIAGQWPCLLGYNRLVARADSEVPVHVDSDPLLVLGRTGEGRAAAFASDCAPHWAPPEFVDWPHYPALWRAIVRWVAGER